MRCLLFCLLPILTFAATAQRDFSDSDITKVVLLGTGTPNPDPDRSGPSVAIVVNDIPYLVDFGPGVVRQAAAMSPRYGGPIEGLAIDRLRHAFLTHLHSDHTTGFADLILAPWVEGRDEPLHVYGPEGITKMSKHLIEAYDVDIKYRLYSTQPANDRGWRVASHEITGEGLIYEDEQVKVEAFPVPHGSWPNAWGYRFTTPDKVVVVSGDTTPSDKLKEYAKGCDILVHEVYSTEKFQERPPFWQTYHSENHTSTHELAEIAEETQPGVLVLYHILFWGASEEELAAEFEGRYQGKVIVGRDLDMY